MLAGNFPVSDHLMPGNPSAPGNLTPGNLPAPGNLTPGNPSASGNLTPGNLPASGNLMPENPPRKLTASPEGRLLLRDFFTAHFLYQKQIDISFYPCYDDTIKTGKRRGRSCPFLRGVTRITCTSIYQHSGKPCKTQVILFSGIKKRRNTQC